MLENLELRKAMHTAKAASEPTILQVSPLSKGLSASREAAAGYTICCLQCCCVSTGKATDAYSICAGHLALFHQGQLYQQG